jgi:exopolyphosphatase/pppGpp-phosphohydrolase
LQAGEPFVVVVLGSSSITAEAFSFWPSLPLLGQYRGADDAEPLSSPLELKQSCRFVLPSTTPPTDSNPPPGSKLDQMAIQRAFEILLPYLQAASASGVKRFFGLATEAFRAADPRTVDDFFHTLYEQSGQKLAITVLTGDEEAELAAAAAKWQLGREVDNAIVLDFGSASLDLAWMKDGHIQLTDSLPIGPLYNQQPSLALEALRNSPVVHQLHGRTLIVRGGLMTKTGLLALRENAYPLDRIDGFGITTAMLLPILAKWMHQDFTQRRDAAARFNLAAAQQAHFAYALQVLHGLLTAITPRRVVFTQAGLHEGLAFGFFPPEWQQQDRMLDWCWQLAKPWATPNTQSYLQQLEKQVMLQQDFSTHRHRRLLTALCWLTLVQQAVQAGQAQSPLPLLTNAVIPELSPQDRAFLLTALIHYDRTQDEHRRKLEAFAQLLLLPEDTSRAQNLGFLLREISSFLLAQSAR